MKIQKNCAKSVKLVLFVMNGVIPCIFGANLQHLRQGNA